MAGKIELHDTSHPTFKQRQAEALKAAKEAAEKKNAPPTPTTPPPTK